MFIGHFAVGMALKPVAPRVSLGTLFFAAQFLDLLWPTLLLTGIERVEIAPGTPGPPLRFTEYPISHSLVMVAGWAVLIGGIHLAVRRSLRSACVCALAVISHWVLDLIVHHPDLPLAPGSSGRFGFGLWRSLPASLLLEVTIFGVGGWIYARSTTAIDAVGRWAFTGLIVLLSLIHLANVFGAPPPSVTAVAWVGQAQWLLVVWAYWVDRHRRSRQTPPA